MTSPGYNDTPNTPNLIAFKITVNSTEYYYISNYLFLDNLFNSLLMLITKLHITGLLSGIHQWPLVSLTESPVMWKTLSWNHHDCYHLNRTFGHRSSTTINRTSPAIIVLSPPITSLQSLPHPSSVMQLQ